MNILLHVGLSVALIPVVCTSALGQDDTAQKQFTLNWPTMCKSFVGRALNNDTVVAITAQSPISESVVCECVASRMRDDRHLKFLFVGDANQARTTMANGGFENYFKGKITSYSFACVAVELARSVDGLVP